MTDQNPGPPGWQPLGYASGGPDMAFGKWRTGGIIFGIIAIVIGGSSGCLGILVPLALFVPQPNKQNPPAAIISGAVLYLAAAGSLIWLGIGAIKMRRWVRPLVLALGTVIFIGGIFCVFWMAFYLPAIRSVTSGNRATPGLQGGMFPFFMAVTMLFMGFLFFIIPGAFVWFYKKQEVKEALEYFDPVPGWTDRCPIPVLVPVVALTLFTGVTLISMPQAIMPVFGTVLFGPAAMATNLIFAATALVLAWLLYRCRPAGWWGTIVFNLALAIAYLMTSLKSDLPDLYRKAGYNAQQLDMIGHVRDMGFVQMFAMQSTMPILAIGYMAYIRKYFKRHTHDAR